MNELNDKEFYRSEESYQEIYKILQHLIRISN